MVYVRHYDELQNSRWKSVFVGNDLTFCTPEKKGTTNSTTIRSREEHPRPKRSCATTRGKDCESNLHRASLLGGGGGREQI